MDKITIERETLERLVRWIGGSRAIIETDLFNDLRAALAAQPAEPVAWCALTASGEIAYFDGKPMVMVGPVGNEHHQTALYAAQKAQPAPPPMEQAALAAQPAEPVAAALDRMDQLFEPACGLLSISYGSATVQASRADMQIIRAALAAPPAPAAVPLTKEQRELFDLILHHYGPDKRLQPLRDLIAAAGDKP